MFQITSLIFIKKYILLIIVLSLSSICQSSRLVEEQDLQNIKSFVEMFKTQLKEDSDNKQSCSLFKKYIIPETFRDYKTAFNAYQLGLSIFEHQQYSEVGLSYILFAEMHYIPDSLVLIRHLTQGIIKNVPENIKKKMQVCVANQEEYEFKHKLYENITETNIKRLLGSSSNIVSLSKFFIKSYIPFKVRTKPIIKLESISFNDIPQVQLDLMNNGQSSGKQSSEEYQTSHSELNKKMV